MRMRMYTKPKNQDGKRKHKNNKRRKTKSNEWNNAAGK